MFQIMLLLEETEGALRRFEEFWGGMVTLLTQTIEKSRRA